MAINTVATINASLMVFIIQNTQVRESMALHLKIDELIRVTKEAENEVIAIEPNNVVGVDITSEEIIELRSHQAFDRQVGVTQRIAGIRPGARQVRSYGASMYV